MSSDPQAHQIVIGGNFAIFMFMHSNFISQSNLL